MDMAELGRTPKGGVRRLALTDLDNEARATLARWGAKRGFKSFIDPIGNFFVRREGSDPSLPPVMSGSHTDTQPSGGRFDGIYGVLAALEALEAIDDAGIGTRRAIEAAVWTCEEGGGGRWPGTLGSSVFAGARSLAEVLPLADFDGLTVGAALKRTRAHLPMAADRPLGIPVHAFVEAHIEQGPELEARGKTIGVVTAIQGVRRFLVEVVGEDGHSGTLRRALRRDAFVAAAQMAVALQTHFHDPEDVVRFTIGRFVVEPNAPAVVPGKVTFSIDFRHPDDAVLARLGDGVAGICQAHRGPCAVQVKETLWVKPTAFSGLLPALIRSAADRLGLSSMPILSGAGHDAIYLARVCPTAMIFVPCEKGISHNEAENATPYDLASGARVLAEVLAELANR
ncbi:MAG: hydantoinase/carbamoylase family amidase [Alphaproteobacteria bacterium]|nr:hydantoinase/carbamoylase family amidase [Alphaproteobacteria bacterium]